MPPPVFERAMNTAREAAEAAGEAAMRRLKRGFDATPKQDGSLVTDADIDAEAAALDILRLADPDYSILSEEAGALEGDPSSRWILDPLDGTNRFARGGRFWGPLVALQHEGRVVAGAMALPALGEVYWAARGFGCYCNGERLHVSTIKRWQDAVVSVGGIRRLLESPWRRGALSLIEASSYTFAGADLGGCAMVLSAQADVWMEHGVQIWDLAPFQILIEEAGGVFTDLSGAETIASGGALASNGALHASALKALASGAVDLS